MRSLENEFTYDYGNYGYINEVVVFLMVSVLYYKMTLLDVLNTLCDL